MEACGTAHYWGRVAQQHGYVVSLLPAEYVRPYVRRNKTDRADADGLLEAVRSGEIRVLVKSVTLDLIRFGGHLPEGGYDVLNGGNEKPAVPPAVHD